MHRITAPGLATVMTILFLSPVHTEELLWPVESAVPLQISSTFGESRSDHFHNGLDVPARGLRVRAVAAGKLRYHYQRSRKANELPFGGGGTVLIDHNGFWSGYMHLESIQIGTSVKAGERIGISGDTGHSGGAHLHFFLYSPQKREFHNPLRYLNSDFYTDTKPPEISEFAVLLPRDGRPELSVIRADKPFTMSGDFPLYARITDRGKGGERWGVYRLQISRGPAVVRSVRFDSIAFREGKWTSEGAPFESVYHGSWYLLGTGFRAQPSFTITTAGYAGPVTEQSVTLLPQ